METIVSDLRPAIEAEIYQAPPPDSWRAYWRRGLGWFCENHPRYIGD
jgi:hypothetical protein